MADKKKDFLDLPEDPKTEKESPAPADEAHEDDALNSFLSREQKGKKPSKLPQSRKTLFILLTAAVIVAGLILALIFLRHSPVKSEEEEHIEAAYILSVNEDGVHEADVTVDENGNIKQNGYGSLLTYVPAQIKQIDIENQDGSFSVTSSTPEGKATVYEVVGFEDYPLQSGIADSIAGHCAALDFSKIISADATLADYGLEKPRATATVTYADDTSAVILVGDNAPASAGTYVAFGSKKAVYLVSTDSVSDFLYSVNSLISSSITDTVEDSDNMAFSTLTISGSHFDEPITLVPNTDQAINASYLITSPRRMIADEVESHDIAGNIRGLFAESVACVNPSKDQMKSYGLSEPYAAIQATYPDAEISLQSSAPGDDGTVYLYNPNSKIIYTIQLAAVSWAKTSLATLMPENPLNANLAYVDQIDFSAGDTSFTLDLTSTTSTVTDEDTDTEQEVTETTASYKGKPLDTDHFTVFFQNLTTIKNLGYSEKSGSGEVMRVTLRYTTDREADTLTVYGSDDNTYYLTFNGEKIGTVKKTYIADLIEGAKNLIAGKAVESL